MKKLRVLMSREEIASERLHGATAVVIDTFLATTTLVTILENGARRVFPVASLEEAEELGGSLEKESLLRGGEQNALNIEGYDCGPYPGEYPPEIVRDRDVIFVTTNGTRAIATSSPASPLLVGCLRNAPAVARYIENSGTESVYLICAGSAGRFTIEDFLGAATILAHLTEPDGWHLNDAAWMARDFARHRLPQGDPAGALDVLEKGRAGRWFAENGHMEEIQFVGDIGASDLVAEVKGGRLRRIEDAPEPAADTPDAGRDPG